MLYIQPAELSTNTMCNCTARNDIDEKKNFSFRYVILLVRTSMMSAKASVSEVYYYTIYVLEMILLKIKCQRSRMTFNNMPRSFENLWTDHLAAYSPGWLIHPFLNSLQTRDRTILCRLFQRPCNKPTNTSITSTHILSRMNTFFSPGISTNTCEKSLNIYCLWSVIPAGVYSLDRIEVLDLLESRVKYFGAFYFFLYLGSLYICCISQFYQI